jgi:hypothetical protein
MLIAQIRQRRTDTMILDLLGKHEGKRLEWKGKSPKNPTGYYELLYRVEAWGLPFLLLETKPIYI